MLGIMKLAIFKIWSSQPKNRLLGQAPRARLERRPALTHEPKGGLQP
jgi:hypothetical protein